MRTEAKYYLLESGALYDVADTYRKARNERLKELREFAISLGADGWVVSEGQMALRCLQFKGGAPNGFKIYKKDEQTYRPRKDNKQYDDFFSKDGPATTFKPLLDVWDAVRNAGFPCTLRYTSGYGGRGSCSTMDYFWLDAPVFWLEANGLFCLVTGDIEAKAKQLRADGCTIENYNGAPDLAALGLTPILREEWDLMRAKHKQQQENKA